MNGREQARLAKARENGYLDARCKDNQALVRAYGMWCWRLRIPMVWLERRSRYSAFGRVQLEMFTSANRLTAGGQAGDARPSARLPTPRPGLRFQLTMPVGIMSPCRMRRNWRERHFGRRAGRRIMNETKAPQRGWRKGKRGRCCGWPSGPAVNVHANIRNISLCQSPCLSITSRPRTRPTGLLPSRRCAILNVEGRSVRLLSVEKTTKRDKNVPPRWT